MKGMMCGHERSQEGSGPCPQFLEGKSCQEKGTRRGNIIFLNLVIVSNEKLKESYIEGRAQRSKKTFCHSLLSLSDVLEISQSAMLAKPLSGCSAVPQRDAYVAANVL